MSQSIAPLEEAVRFELPYYRYDSKGMKVVLLSLREMFGLARSFSVVETKKTHQNIINGNRISVARRLWERGCFRENN